MSKIPGQYRKAIEQIRIDAENFANSSMKNVYSLNKKALNELHMKVAKIYIDYAQDGYLKLSRQDKKKITADVNNKLKSMGLNLGKAEVATVSSILGSVFKTTYYKNAFVLESGMSGNIKFNILKKEFIDSAINAKFKEATFSDRIWNNKANMIDKLKKSIVEAYKGNTAIDKIAKDIQHTFNVSASDSNRLVATETARVAVKAQEQIGIDSGCKEVMWSATLDSRTAPYDASLDGKVWGINENHPEPVMDTHPRCRCVLINVPFAEWKPSKRKDNETKEIIDYKTYDEWLKDKGIGGDEE
ncbi:minor capsid protein [Clostridium tyrobutyricum]|uniref:minor capsid protein n=1 Tax=Clostridium tyrobutyricum TaxID=1519 RepID=UPI0010A9BB8F|nr:minor capsid protein [Clostridium tyrobutyricum]QCH29262.1 NAD(+)-arginine ADP-ribosyltransferase EFV [Clostridium tyrobutyricum]